MHVAWQRDRAFLVRGVDDAKQRLGGVRCDWEQGDIVDDDPVRSDRRGDRFDAAVGSVAA